MARPNSEGFTYFCHDVDMSSDEKIELLESRHGLIGYAVYNKLLERIYRSGGFFDISLQETLKVSASKYKVKLEQLKRIINSCVEFELFDKEMFEKNILTSYGIAKRAKPLYDNRLNNRGKDGFISLTETEKQFYSYIKVTPKQFQKNGHSRAEQSRAEESKGESAHAREKKHPLTIEGAKKNGSFDWVECTRQLVTSDEFKKQLFKKFAWSQKIYHTEMHKFVLYLQEDSSRKPPKNEVETIARYEKFLLNSHDNPHRNGN